MVMLLPQPLILSLCFLNLLFGVLRSLKVVLLPLYNIFPQPAIRLQTWGEFLDQIGSVCIQIK
jgi:hypothetical protein